MNNLPNNKKPQWKDAPQWAKFLCKDHGMWYWAESYPDEWGGVSGFSQDAGTYDVGVSEAPEPRPE
jgi:hypothetical protein